MAFCSKQYAAYAASCLSFYMLAISIQVAVLGLRTQEILRRAGGELSSLLSRRSQIKCR